MIVEDSHLLMVKAPSRRAERKNWREPTTPRKSLFLIWDEDIGRWRCECERKVSFPFCESQETFRQPIERKRRYSYTDSMLLAYIRRISEKLFDTISTALRFTFRLEQRRGGELTWKSIAWPRYTIVAVTTTSTANHHNLWPSHRNRRAQSIQRQT